MPSSASSSYSSMLRSGTCQHTSGFTSLWWTPVRIEYTWSAQPGPASKPGRLRKMQASSTSRVR